MRRIGITGQYGFIGTHTYNFLGLYPEKFERIEFKRAYFDDSELLDEFVSNTDVIIHLAGLNRHNNSEVLYKTNIALTKNLIASLQRTKSKAHVLFSSSIQEEKDNLYGQSKKISRILLNDWADSCDGKFTGFMIPNVFGPFGSPFYNSVIATYCYQLTHGEIPTINVDVELELIYIDDLINVFLKCIRDKTSNSIFEVKPTFCIKVSDTLSILQKFKDAYFENGQIPNFNNKFEINLFNTFRSYFNLNTHFPVKYKNNIDERGNFVEIIRLETGGQISFSTTRKNIVRGNHFHTRKIERFSVLKGNALIKLRKIGGSEVFDYYLSGDEPAYVDMPIWYTHSIKNIGEEDLYTMFWINEFYNTNDPDTYFEIV